MFPCQVGYRMDSDDLVHAEHMACEAVDIIELQQLSAFQFANNLCVRRSEQFAEAINEPDRLATSQPVRRSVDCYRPVSARSSPNQGTDSHSTSSLSRVWIDPRFRVKKTVPRKALPAKFAVNV